MERQLTYARKNTGGSKRFGIEKKISITLKLKSLTSGRPYEEYIY